MKSIFQRHFIVIIFVVVLGLLVQNALAFENFVTRKGAILYDGQKEYRFVSVNIPNYFIVEDRAGTQGEKWHRITAFEQRDAARAVKLMGGQVFRTYTFSVEGGRNVAGKLAHIYADENGNIAYNEDLFKDVDRGIAIAAEEGVRLVIPLVDNWQWFGGFAEWARLSGVRNFWSDEAAKENFKAFITWLLNRKNTVTGIVYKDDPTIMVWELGNEIDKANETWIAEMAAHIKSIDSKHLVLDGGHKNTPGVCLTDDNIDMVATHYTDNQITQFAKAATEAKKPYIYGEFEPIDMSIVKNIIGQVFDSGAAGCFAWSLRFRTDIGGFYYHSDFNSRSDSLNYPGFDTTLPKIEKEVISFLKAKAYEIRGMEVPADPIPAAPKLLAIESPSAINWQGSAGAVAYDVQILREDGNWQTIGADISDAVTETYQRDIVAKLPLFSHETGAGTGTYRVIAKNEAGKSEPSNIVSVTVQ